MCVVLLCILAFFCPPLAVLFDQGCTAQFWINFLLTLLIWISRISARTLNDILIFHSSRSNALIRPGSHRFYTNCTPAMALNTGNSLLAFRNG
ncbi:hypothetical protein Q1695_007179 [Nippostrongylus brasiliensis]|nr:hypothetical protein Q1695_007179 [Nippostrongylus brasiliensis]